MYGLPHAVGHRRILPSTEAEHGSHVQQVEQGLQQEANRTSVPISPAEVVMTMIL
jgi:hypothetical protein